MQKITAAITAVGGYVPEDKLTNADFERMVETNDEWIRTRTGIEERHILKGEGKATSDLVVPAVQDLCKKRGIEPDEIECLIVATITPDMFFPNTANVACDKLGIKHAWGFDIMAACSGFLYALTTAASLIESGRYKRVAVVGADKMSSIVDYTDRTTCILFGDGAGAVLLEPNQEGFGVLDSILKSDGSGGKYLHMKGGGSLNPPSAETVAQKMHYLFQDGQPVFKFAVTGMADVSYELIQRNNLSADDVAWLVPHQANKRIIDATARRMGLSDEKVLLNIQRYGNTTAATIPLCLWDYQGRFKRGDNIVLAAFGGGFTWGNLDKMGHMNVKAFKGFGSLAIHAGHVQDPMYAHLTPLYASSTYVYDEAEQGMRRFSGKEPGYIYSRWGNPTMSEAERKIAAMETYRIQKSGQPLEAMAILHASGMAAISSLFMSTLKAGDKILTHYSLYSGTEQYLKQLLEPLGLHAVIADLRDLSLTEKLLKEDKAIKLVYLETPANPTLQCVDLEALSVLARQYGKVSACDNTFATPFLQQPFKFGIDFVVHSTTKFLNGHGTAIGGVLVGTDLEFMKTAATRVHRLLGGNSNAFDAFLLVNGMKTLEVRMLRHCENAMQVAKYLDGHPGVSRVNYNGLASHPDYAVSNKQMSHPGAMMSFELKDGFDAGVRFMNKLQLCTRTVSLGTCDTLLSHPASMSHSSVPRENRLEYGITDGLIRMSVGMENIEDILEDFQQALP